MIFKNLSPKAASISTYTKLNKICYGNYANIFKASNNETGKFYALKEVNPTMCFDNNGFSILYLREITVLKKLNHKNIVKIKEVIVGKKISEIYLVMELLELDLKMIMNRSGGLIPTEQVKGIIKQLLSGLNYIHKKKILHRDIKPSNILFSIDGTLKLADFGLARKISKTMSNLVVTLWYRAPEILLGATSYDYSIDIWAVGCVIGEISTGSVLFPGKGEINQIHEIFLKLGFPKENDFEIIDVPLFKNLINQEEYMKGRNITQGFRDTTFVELVDRMLVFNPSSRITSEEALKYSIFDLVEDDGLIRETIKKILK
ncbi:putative cell division protein kinase [Astathelohania contejeani]|uniref:Cell division protein kinase n=1 Tax=Astathelohania contejeani TaxID=164912 RepID=A0ABQ7HZ84_9MICR|nr:putative cell division protein kinase [Thelohania contejeani]